MVNGPARGAGPNAVATRSRGLSLPAAGPKVRWRSRARASFGPKAVAISDEKAAAYQGTAGRLQGRCRLLADQPPGDRKGEYAVTVRANWRITFAWDGEDAVDVNYVDYH